MADAALRAHALGRVFRGISHELANTLNNVAMNAELARLSPEDCADALDTITRNGRDGGRFLKQLSAFASADRFSPAANSSVAEALSLARRLIASRARREGIELELCCENDVHLPLDTTGLALTLASLIDLLCGRAGKVAVSVKVEKNMCAISVDHDGGEVGGGMAVDLAAAFSSDHGGQLLDSARGWKMLLPL